MYTFSDWTIWKCVYGILIQKVFFDFAAANTEGLELKCISKIRKGEKVANNDASESPIFLQDLEENC